MRIKKPECKHVWNLISHTKHNTWKMIANRYRTEWRCFDALHHDLESAIDSLREMSHFLRNFCGLFTSSMRHSRRVANLRTIFGAWHSAISISRWGLPTIDCSNWFPSLASCRLNYLVQHHIKWYQMTSLETWLDEFANICTGRQTSCMDVFECMTVDADKWAHHVCSHQSNHIEFSIDARESWFSLFTCQSILKLIKCQLITRQFGLLKWILKTHTHSMINKQLLVWRMHIYRVA